MGFAACVLFPTAVQAYFLVDARDFKQHDLLGILVRPMHWLPSRGGVSAIHLFAANPLATIVLRRKLSKGFSSRDGPIDSNRYTRRRLAHSLPVPVLCMNLPFA